MTNACMTDSATLGDWETAVPTPEQKPISGELWAKVAEKTGARRSLPFFGNEDETCRHLLLSPAKAIIY